MPTIKSPTKVTGGRMKRYLLETYVKSDRFKIKTEWFKTKSSALLSVEKFADEAFPQTINVKRISDTLWLAEDKNGFGLAIRLRQETIYD